MKEDFLITIRGRIEQNGDSDQIELITRGSFVQRSGSYFITYQETEATGYVGCTTTVKVEGSHRVSMLRFGPAASQLIIEKEKRHICHYETGHGALELGIAAEDIESALTAQGGSVNFSYTLDVDTAMMSRNFVNITVRPVV